MLTQSTKYLSHISFQIHSFSMNVNLPLRMNSVSSFGLDCTPIRRLVLHAPVDCIQVMTNTKRSDSIAMALVKTGTAPTNLVNLSLSPINITQGRPTAEIISLVSQIYALWRQATHGSQYRQWHGRYAKAHPILYVEDSWSTKNILGSYVRQ